MVSFFNFVFYFSNKQYTKGKQKIKNKLTKKKRKQRQIGTYLAFFFMFKKYAKLGV